MAVEPTHATIYNTLIANVCKAEKWKTVFLVCCNTFATTDISKAIKAQSCAKWTHSNLDWNKLGHLNENTIAGCRTHSCHYLYYFNCECEQVEKLKTLVFVVFSNTFATTDINYQGNQRSILCKIDTFKFGLK